MATEKKNVEDILAKYKQRLVSEISTKQKKNEPIRSREYHTFREELLPTHMSLYERLCAFSAKLLKIAPDKKKVDVVKESIRISHLHITPEGAMSFSIIFPLLLSFVGILLSTFIPIIVLGLQGKDPVPNTFFIFFSLLMGVLLIYPLSNMPQFLANNWRMRASNQMVICIFYVVTYMRQTSNLELAVNFAAEHLDPPLSLDLKKVLWDVENGTYPDVKTSLDAYLVSWKKYNLEFVEAFHLIESSLYEGSEQTRVATLNKALSLMLEETYEKMLHFAQGLQSPITMLNMLGVVLPILGLVILPLAVNFLEGIKWYHIAVLYNVLLPVVVFYMGKNILSNRPTGYGDTDITEKNPALKKYKSVEVNLGFTKTSVSPLSIALAIGLLFLFIGSLPLILHALDSDFDLVFDARYVRESGSLLYDQEYIDTYLEGTAPPYLLQEYLPSKEDSSVSVGPYGLGASLLSVFVTLAAGLTIALFYRLKSKNVIDIRNRTKKLEAEFGSALYQLGNRLGDNLPAEIAFEKVAGIMQGTLSGNFFTMVNANIRRLGMSVQRALFDPKVGAIRYFPSSIIESSMKVLIQSARKGPLVASSALIGVSEYIKEMHRVNERLKDLMAEIVSSMHSQINFLTPVIAGIVVGISAMITTILNKLSSFTKGIGGEGAVAGGVGTDQISNFFPNDAIPPYFMQIIVGLYVVQILYLLITMTSAIENGSDKLSEEYLLGRALLRSTIVYCAISFSVILLFSVIVGNILCSQTGTC